MAKIMLIQVRNQALRTYLAGKKSVRIFGITSTIRHALDIEYQVLLPDEDEIIRIVDRGNGRLRAFVV
ncbi:MAG: hypothetical protein IJH25_00215 [Clostridia bacterium]|nr:hypothetical protein [Clostridia bacterium]